MISMSHQIHVQFGSSTESDCSVSTLCVHVNVVPMCSYELLSDGSAFTFSNCELHQHLGVNNLWNAQWSLQKEWEVALPRTIKNDLRSWAPSRSIVSLVGPTLSAPSLLWVLRSLGLAPPSVKEIQQVKHSQTVSKLLTIRVCFRVIISAGAMRSETSQ